MEIVENIKLELLNWSNNYTPINVKCTQNEMCFNYFQMIRIFSDIDNTMILINISKICESKQIELFNKAILNEFNNKLKHNIKFNVQQKTFYNLYDNKFNNEFNSYYLFTSPEEQKNIDTKYNKLLSKSSFDNILYNIFRKCQRDQDLSKTIYTTIFQQIFEITPEISNKLYDKLKELYNKNKNLKARTRNGIPFSIKISRI
jgi:hypothetical protein